MQALTHGWNLHGITSPPTAELDVNQNIILFKASFSDPSDYDASIPAGEYTPDLWKQDCAEFFILFGENRYFEFNVSPSGAVWWQMMDGIRTPDSKFSKSSVLVTVVVRSQYLIEICLEFVAGILPSPLVGNICIIQKINGERRFFSLQQLPGEKPDFHQPKSWSTLTTS